MPDVLLSTAVDGGIEVDVVVCGDYGVAGVAAGGRVAGVTAARRKLRKHCHIVRSDGVPWLIWLGFGSFRIRTRAKRISDGERLFLSPARGRCTAGWKQGATLRSSQGSDVTE